MALGPECGRRHLLDRVGVAQALAHQPETSRALLHGRGYDSARPRAQRPLRRWSLRRPSCKLAPVRAGVSMIVEEIRQVLEAKADALLRRSVEDMATLLHPDFVYVNAGGYKFDKAGYIENGCTSGRLVFRSQRVSELEVRQFDDFAVATMFLNDQFFSQLEGSEVWGLIGPCVCSARKR